MRRVQNLATLHHDLEQLDNLEDAVLAVLPRHGQAAPTGSQPVRRRPTQPRDDHHALPRVRRQAIPRRQETRIATVVEPRRTLRLKLDARLLPPEQHGGRCCLLYTSDAADE